MNKKTIIIVVISVITFSGIGIGIGLYYWLNPLGAGYYNLESGDILSDGTLLELDSSHWGEGKSTNCTIS